MEVASVGANDGGGEGVCEGRGIFEYPDGYIEHVLTSERGKGVC